MKKPKFNIIDLLIIVVIAAVIAAGVYILGSKTETQTKTKTAEVIFTIEEKEVDPVRMEYYKENAKVGDTVTVGIKEKVTGTLEKVEIVPTKKMFTDSITGQKSWKDELSRYDLTFTIKAEITETDTDFLIGTAKIKVGKSQNFIGKGYSGYGTVVAIEKVGGDE